MEISIFELIVFIRYVSHCSVLLIYTLLFLGLQCLLFFFMDF